ncbi:MAG: hypothetical protein K8S23_06375 [Candidatus Cloacimonetes bacterium]|nr:hypothetical protein [Candidatus Cloacimonadota bacterium]
MGLKTFIINFVELKTKDSLRLWIPFVLPKLKYKYGKINDFLTSFESGSRPKGGIREEDIGEAISLGGEQIGSDGNLNLAKIPYVSFDFFKNSKKGKVKNNDILICKDGALTGKTCLVDFSKFPSKEVMINEHIFILRGNENINQIFLYYYTTSNLFQSQIKDLAYKKKAQPGLNTNHFKKVKIPLIPKIKQNQFATQIKPIERKIKKLKAQIFKPQDIINKVFAREFNFDLEKIEKEEQRKQFFVSSSLSFRNPNLRSSVRWHKIFPIQQAMYKKINCIKKLGDYVLSTKNGWSPSCSNDDTLNLVFSVKCISKSGVINYEDLKVSDQTCSNIESYFVQNNDLFVSRGNTIDLVALASVVENLPDEKDIIFPDLFIKLNIDETKLDKKYLAYLFNSIIGRYYFKYSAKGKNQTMVKISSDELLGFFLPVPSLTLQQKMVFEIETELDIQENNKKQVILERSKIAKIINNLLSYTL